MGLLGYCQYHRLASFDRSCPYPGKASPEFHCRNIPEPQIASRLRGDSQRRHLFGRCGVDSPLDKILIAVGIHHTSGGIVVAPFESFQHFGEGDPVEFHLFRRQKHLHLPLLSTDYRYLGHTGRCQQLTAYLSVHDVSQVKYRSRIRGQSDYHNLPEDG